MSSQVSVPEVVTADPSAVASGTADGGSVVQSADATGTAIDSAAGSSVDGFQTSGVGAGGSASGLLPSSATSAVKAQAGRVVDGLMLGVYVKWILGGWLMLAVIV